MNDTVNPRAAADQARAAYRNILRNSVTSVSTLPFQTPCGPSPRRPWLRLARSMTVPRML